MSDSDSIPSFSDIPDYLSTEQADEILKELNADDISNVLGDEPQHQQLGDPQDPQDNQEGVQKEVKQLIPIQLVVVHAPETQQQQAQYVQQVQQYEDLETIYNYSQIAPGDYTLQGTSTSIMNANTATQHCQASANDSAQSSKQHLYEMDANKITDKKLRAKVKKAQNSKKYHDKMKHCQKCLELCMGNPEMFQVVDWIKSGKAMVVKFSE